MADLNIWLHRKLRQHLDHETRECWLLNPVLGLGVGT